MKTFFGRKDRGSFEIRCQKKWNEAPGAGKDRFLRVVATISFEAGPLLWENTQVSSCRFHENLLVSFYI